jgi:hypothetical protein
VRPVRRRGRWSRGVGVGQVVSLRTLNWSVKVTVDALNPGRVQVGDVAADLLQPLGIGVEAAEAHVDRTEHGLFSFPDLRNAGDGDVADRLLVGGLDGQPRFARLEGDGDHLAGDRRGARGDVDLTAEQACGLQVGLRGGDADNLSLVVWPIWICENCASCETNSKLSIGFSGS